MVKRARILKRILTLQAYFWDIFSAWSIHCKPYIFSCCNILQKLFKKPLTNIFYGMGKNYILNIMSELFDSPRNLAKTDMNLTRKLMRKKQCFRCGYDLPRGWKEPFCYNCKHRFGGRQIIIER